MELKKELQERPTQKLVDDLKKKVQILQVLQQKKILVHCNWNSTHLFWDYQSTMVLSTTTTTKPCSPKQVVVG